MSVLIQFVVKPNEASEEEEYDLFLKENGESHSEYCKRKGIK